MDRPEPPPPNADQGARHLEESVAEMLAFHDEHRQAATPLERTAAGLVDRLGQPLVVVVLAVAILVWVMLGVAREGFDAPTHGALAWLELMSTVAALLVAMLILAGQRHVGLLSEKRNQLALQLALISDRRMAKVIELLEDLRRDLPAVADRHDPEIADMARPSSPQEVLDAIDRQSGEESP